MAGTITNEKIGTETILFKIEGGFDVDCAPDLRFLIEQLFFEKNKKHLMIDLSQANYVDSTALGVLVATLKKCIDNRQNQQLFILNPNDRVSRILEISGLDKVLNIYPSVEDALASI